ncbi:uncharacterized protein LOC128736819 [Sabethes cyaneus]|uniref:uncharacterized protein LOC128736819 n=1 Tax=Sabethes cyaneus TaxID=53552 RepID=UPI00237DDAF3|nr:uncharacterized protein LOC128736819 [Sabethes cyaneus]
MRESIKYSSLKPKSQFSLLANRLLSKSFFRKYGILCGVLLAGLTYLVYHRASRQYYIYQTLPAYQRSLHFELSSEGSREQQYQSDRWQPIGDPQRRFQIYSAYFDDRLEIVEDLPIPKDTLPFGSVRIITILPLNVEGKKVFCNFWYEGRPDEIHRTQADQVQAIHEHFDMPFAATFVTCMLTGNMKHTKVTLPNQVGLSYELEPSMVNETSFVPIHYNKWKILPQGHPNWNLAVCVGPLHHNYGNAGRLVEFIEYWQLLGAERFYFYNKSISADVNRVLNYYQDRGEAEVHEWNVDGYQFEQELRYEGIFAAINDCMYRATVLGEFTYTAVVDLDEFILPTGGQQQQGGGLHNLLREQDRYDANSFNFRAVFFYGKYEEDFSRKPDWTNNSYLYTQVRNQRTKFPLEHHHRSKYVAIGRNVIEGGNHFVWKALRGTKEYRIPPETGLLFHYRDNFIGYGDEFYIEDNTARQYENRIWGAVDSVCSKLFPENYGRCPMGGEEND